MSVNIGIIKKAAVHYRGSTDHLNDLNVFTDSRQQTEQGLFVPIVGERFDGHEFIAKAIEAGAVASLWMKDRQLPEEVPADFPIFYVDDTLGALQTMAKLVLKERQPKIVAVTGSNGKTTTKDIIESVVSTKYKTHKTKGNFNNHIGMPLTILDSPDDCEVMILEMGMNHFGEISLLSRIAEPDIAVITNIGESHIEFLGSREGIAKAKMEIVDGLKTDGLLIIDGDEPLLRSFNLDDFHTVTCGYGDDNGLRIGNVKAHIKGYSFTINGEDMTYHIPLLGRHNVKNASYALAVAQSLNIDAPSVQKGFEQLSVTGMRLETVKGRMGTMLINDSYNASPTSMMAAIETVKNLPDYNRKVVVLGDMHELGPDEENLHRQVAQTIEAPITDLITIGTKAQWIADEASKHSPSYSVHSYTEKAQALPFIESLLSNKTVILIKASRAAQLESLVEQLEA
ncbi:UDP-N-acetylmuramoyl-tripeptide--D-alanyl-D-alanine ligase [Scopulibacillus daqui]|uniref:UDP-N-acetylmuramoyl-tripeptide--D-alanyl-D-alanine ligase n=1 Tax=Scopulibacillus daqui TaxID=1469162 RepID=A0ABS2PW16_9BACL|nr:UDP-N-acetylmuramoyl-tripeptide--D-alanyl-D-alanine ligase [Scopulibacillus daqui]MBM7644263.1 UDP-N-acetylmuramoyl-tripeptide--D-alanyl-D-alanine ligase [Scopulibacillus daqui]